MLAPIYNMATFVSGHNTIMTTHFVGHTQQNTPQNSFIQCLGVVHYTINNTYCLKLALIVIFSPTNTAKSTTGKANEVSKKHDC